MRRLVIMGVILLAAAGCTAGVEPSAQPVPSFLVAATPTVELRPTPTPSSPVSSPVAEARWDRVGTIAPQSTDDGGGPIAAVGFEDGYVLSDLGGYYLIDTTPKIQFSKDGTAWASVRLPLGKGSVLQAMSFATDGKRVLALGGYTPCKIAAYNEDPYGRCRRRPASWVSDDGLTWRGSGPSTGTIGPAGQGGSAFGSAWVVPTGGWDAAQEFYTGDESDDGVWIGAALWHSADGLTWSRLRAQTSESTSSCASDGADTAFWALADADGRRVGSCSFSVKANRTTWRSIPWPGWYIRTSLRAKVRNVRSG